MAAVTRRPAAVAALALVLALAVASCGGGSADDGASAAPIPAINATTAELLPTDAAALPGFDPSTFDALLQQLRGTPVLVNVWGSWCAPCRDEAPTLAAAHDRFGRDVQFLGVDILDARGSARGFMGEYGWTYPSVFDPPGAIRDSLGLLGQPVTLLYDRSGEVVHRWVGPVPKDELDPALERLANA
jgi:cytochrome c biogenesis protein CcmG, thiol:disulfide interchange protein DsbE